MHNVPHTAEAKARMSAALRGKLRPNKQRPSVIVGAFQLWRCSTCQVFKPGVSFYRNKRTVLGLTSQCRTCHSRTTVTSRDLDKSRRRGVLDAARRRARIANSGGDVRVADMERLLELLGVACLRCHSTDKPTWDHVVPLARGGQHHPRNLQPLCRPCNEKKQARTADYRTDAQRSAVAMAWPSAVSQ